jgi:hypothetical protein
MSEEKGETVRIVRGSPNRESKSGYPKYEALMLITKPRRYSSLQYKYLQIYMQIQGEKLREKK